MKTIDYNSLLSNVYPCPYLMLCIRTTFICIHFRLHNVFQCFQPKMHLRVIHLIDFNSNLSHLSTRWYQFKNLILKIWKASFRFEIWTNFNMEPSQLLWIHWNLSGYSFTFIFLTFIQGTSTFHGRPVGYFQTWRILSRHSESRSKRQRLYRSGFTGSSAYRKTNPWRKNGPRRKIWT